MTEWRKRLYLKAMIWVARLAPIEVRATHQEVLDRGLIAYKEARTVRTDDLPFKRDERRKAIARDIIGHLETYGDNYNLAYSHSVRQLAWDIASLIEPKRSKA